MDSHAILAARLARETTLPVERIAGIVFAVHKLAGIFGGLCGTSPASLRLANDVERSLDGTGWHFVPNPISPAVERDGEQLQLI